MAAPQFDKLLEDLRNSGKSISQGRISWNLERAYQLLSHHVLEDQSTFLLRLVAAAVAGRASHFFLETTSTGYTVEWDGTGYSSDDLQELFPKLLGGPPRIVELALGLNTARNQFQITLESQGGELTLRGDSLTLDTTRKNLERTKISFTRGRLKSVWSKLKGHPELVHVQNRCLLAPLRWVLPADLSVKHLPVGYPYLQFGSPPVGLEGEPLIKLSVAPGLGEGYLLLGDPIESDLVCHLGVAYPLRERWGIYDVGLVWWNNNLQLDLSRQAITENEAYTDWVQELRKEMAKLLADPIKDELDEPRWEQLLRWLVRVTPALDQVPLFRLGNNQPVSVSELQEIFRAQGYIATAQEPWPDEAPLDSGKVLLMDARARVSLSEKLPHQIPVDHLRDETLPAFTALNYLTIFPNPGQPELLGIRADWAIRSRKHSNKRSVDWNCHLPPVDIAYDGDDYEPLPTLEWVQLFNFL